MTYRISIAGTCVPIASREETKRSIEEFLTSTQVRHLITVNPEMLVAAHTQPKFRALIEQACIATIDGFGIILAARLKGYRLGNRDRFTGVDLTEHLLQRAEGKKLSVLIVLPDNALTSKHNLERTLTKLHPTLNAAVAIDGVTPFEMMIQTNPAIIFAAHGAPKQEEWIKRNASLFPSCRIAVGVGGTFDYISGTIKRAPNVLRILGFEWAWRFVREPKRRMMRIVRALFIFSYLSIRYK